MQAVRRDDPVEAGLPSRREDLVQSVPLADEGALEDLERTAL